MPLNDKQIRTLKYQTEVQQAVRSYMEAMLNAPTDAPANIAAGVVDVIKRVGQEYEWTTEPRALPEGTTTLYLLNKENAVDALGRALKAAMAYGNSDALVALVRELPALENGVAVYFGMKNNYLGPKPPSAPGPGGQPALTRTEIEEAQRLAEEAEPSSVAQASRVAQGA